MPRIGRHFMPNMKRAAWGFMQSGDFPVPVLHLKFGENAGNALADSSPEGNDGTNHGATWVNGVLGPGLSLDGLDDYVDVSHDDSITFTSGAFTLMFYLKSTRGAAAQWLLTKGRANVDGWELYMSGLKRLYFYTSQTPDRQYTRTEELSDDVQYRIDVVREGSTVNIYANDVNVVDTVGVHVDPAINTRDLTVGISYGKVLLSAKGIFDELLIFDEALTATQRRQIGRGIR